VTNLSIHLKGMFIMQETIIYYFSGTGNSLYAAKKLAGSLGECSIFSMTHTHPAGQIGGADTKIGFVFPSYYGNLPRIVRRFITELNIHPDSWIFGIVTMGGPFGAGSVAALQKALGGKGLALGYGCGMMMPRNYILKYNGLSDEKSAKYNARANKRLERIAGEIRAKKNRIRKNPIAADNLYNNIESLDAAFFVEDRCTGCGQCEKICPVQNIRLTDGRPVWQHHCEHCVACIQWCPQKAIQYGSITKERRRYHNPAVQASELMEK